MMRLIMRAWREEADGRKARSLRGAKDWEIEARTPSRTPTDCLPTDRSSWRPGRASAENTAQAPGRQAVNSEQRCEGGSSTLPETRSLVQAGSMQRLFLTHTRLVEGGRLKARKESSETGKLKRLAARAWRCRAVATNLQVGWAGLPTASPGDPTERRDGVSVDARQTRLLDRERRRLATQGGARMSAQAPATTRDGHDVETAAPQGGVRMSALAPATTRHGQDVQMTGDGGQVVGGARGVRAAECGRVVPHGGDGERGHEGDTSEVVGESGGCGPYRLF